jgi:resolvase-like protein
MPSLLSRLLS